MNPKDYKSVLNARQIYLLKTDGRRLSACRPITIQSSVLKIVENLALSHLEKLCSTGKIKELHPSQCGFQHHRSTQINICRTIAIMQKAVAEKKNKVGIFVDVKSAFDSVNHALMFDTLKE